MEHIYFTREADFYDEIARAKELGFGKEGTSYLMPSNVVWKCYYPKQVQVFGNFFGGNSEIENYLMQYASVDVANFYFIQALIFSMNGLIGSVTNYASGKTLDNVFLARYSISVIIDALKELEKSVISLSNMGIVIQDCFSGNVLFDGKHFKCIDTSSYLKAECDPGKIYLSNMKMVGKTVINALFRSPYLQRYLMKMSSLKNYQRNIDLITDPIYFIKKLKKELEETLDFEINKFCDVRKPVARILEKSA